LGRALLIYFDLMFGMGTYHFHMRFPHLFIKAKNSLIVTVAQVWNSGNIKISLTRCTSLLLWGEKTQVISILHNLSPIFWEMILRYELWKLRGSFLLNPWMIFLCILNVALSLCFGFEIYVYLGRLNILYGWFYKIKF
jgi:hypothetical protein